MPARIGVVDRIPPLASLGGAKTATVDVGIPVIALDAAGLRHDRVRGDKPRQLRVVKPRNIEVQPYFYFAALTSILIVGGAGTGAQFAVCGVFQYADCVPGRVHGHGGRAKVVREQPGDRFVRAQGDAQA